MTKTYTVELADSTADTLEQAAGVLDAPTEEYIRQAIRNRNQAVRRLLDPDRDPSPSDLPDDPDVDPDAEPMTDGGEREGGRLPATLRDENTPDVGEREQCHGAGPFVCVRDDPELVRGEDEIHVTTWGPGSDTHGRRVLCGECRDRQTALNISEDPELAGLYEPDTLADLQERFPDLLDGVDIPMSDGGTVTVPAGARVGKCDTCGYVTGEYIETGQAAGERVCGVCGNVLGSVVVLDEPWDVSPDNLIGTPAVTDGGREQRYEVGVRAFTHVTVTAPDTDSARELAVREADVPDGWDVDGANAARVSTDGGRPVYPPAVWVQNLAVSAEDADAWAFIESDTHAMGGYWFPVDGEPGEGDPINGFVETREDIPDGDLIQYPVDDAGPDLSGGGTVPEGINDRHVNATLGGGDDSE